MTATWEDWRIEDERQCSPGLKVPAIRTEQEARQDVFRAGGKNWALEECIAEIERMSCWHKVHSAEIGALGDQARSRILAGEDKATIVRWYDEQVCAIPGHGTWRTHP